MQKNTTNKSNPLSSQVSSSQGSGEVEKFEAIALCAIGLEKVLANEIKHIGLTITGRASGRIFFSATSAEIFRANLCLRTAERILIQMAAFSANNFDELFETVRSSPWEMFIAREDAVHIERVRIKDSKISSQVTVQSMVQKAIYERLCRYYKVTRMPETGLSHSVRVYLDKDQCIIGLDTSGEALHKRGYRIHAGLAPLKETLAAGIILLSNWRRSSPLLDPFCGAGTLAIEAALFGLDIAPGLNRDFSLETMPVFTHPSAVRSIQLERDRAQDRVQVDKDVIIHASDIDPAIVEAARENARLAGLSKRIVFSTAKAQERVAEFSEGLLIANPPYGERISTKVEAQELYTELGAWTKQNFASWNMGFITSNSEFEKYFQARARSTHKILNGQEEEYFYLY